MPRPSLSRRQQLVLATIAESVRQRGFPPTFAELGAALGGINKNAVANHLSALASKGYLRREPKSPRAITLL